MYKRTHELTLILLIFTIGRASQNKFPIYHYCLGAWWLVWGIFGIILAIPITAIFKIICDHIESLKPYGFLIGEVETVKKELGFVKKMKTIF